MKVHNALLLILIVMTQRLGAAQDVGSLNPGAPEGLVGGSG